MLLAALALGLGGLWHGVHPGVWVHEAQMAAEGPLAPVHVVALRLDPTLIDLSLSTGSSAPARGGWTIDSLPAAALAAFNAGQFHGTMPWGWLVLDGVEAQPPGHGATTMALVVATDGSVSLVDESQLASARPSARFAFQSYPALLVGTAALPWELQAPDRGVDLEHRDSRLAMGLLADGSVVVALTRFSGMGRVGETLPWGPTVREMADFMRSLGCVRAMLLDGGISSQMALRDADGSLQRWTNWRTVPLGLIASPRTAAR